MDKSAPDLQSFSILNRLNFDLGRVLSSLPVSDPKFDAQSLKHHGLWGAAAAAALLLAAISSSSST